MGNRTGPNRHHYSMRADIATGAEKQAKELARADREISRLRSENEALRGALATTAKVIGPYIPNKNTAPLLRPKGLNEMRFAAINLRATKR